MIAEAQFVGGVVDGQIRAVLDYPPYFFFYVHDGELAYWHEDYEPGLPIPIKKAMYYKLADTSIYVFVRYEE